MTLQVTLLVLSFLSTSMVIDWRVEFEEKSLVKSSASPFDDDSISFSEISCGYAFGQNDSRPLGQECTLSLIRVLKLFFKFEMI